MPYRAMPYHALSYHAANISIFIISTAFLYFFSLKKTGGDMHHGWLALFGGGSFCYQQPINKNLYSRLKRS